MKLKKKTALPSSQKVFTAYTCDNKASCWTIICLYEKGFLQMSGFCLFYKMDPQNNIFSVLFMRFPSELSQ